MSPKGFPGVSVLKNLPANAGDMHSIPGSGRFPWRRKHQLTKVFLLGKSHGQRGLACYSLWGHKRVGHDWATKQQQQRCPPKAWFHSPPPLPRPASPRELAIREKIHLHSIVVQSLSRVQLFATPWSAVYQASRSFTNSLSFLKLMSIELVMPSNHLILSCLLVLLPSIFPSIRILSSELALCIRWPKYCSFSFSICPSNEYSGLISFRMDWLDLLAVQGTLRCLLQHHSLKASILRHSAFFMVQLSYPYMITGKTIALTFHTFVGKLMPLLFNMLSGFVIAFPRSKCLNFIFTQ